MPLLLLWALPLTFLFGGENLPPPVIHNVTPLANAVEQYGKFEASIELTATFANPYDYDEVSVSAVFTAPDGGQKTADGFFMQDYQLNAATGNLTAVGAGGFRIRFSPDQPGNWSYVVTVTDGTGSSSSDALSFSCTPAASAANRGFVRTSTANYLRFDDGTQYIPIGENIAWQSNHPYLNYQDWLTGLADNGGNFLRLWHAHWGLGIEWQNGNNGFQGLRRYKQSNCFYQDWLFDYCAERGLYVMLALQHHGPVSTQVNPNWNESPYNAANGGPCQNTWDFFTDAQARAATKNRYRYIVARWGYARSVLCWELFNEVVWTDNFANVKGDVADWHLEMADYLKGIDPNAHLVTTSYGDSFDDETVWSNPVIDFTQTHFYINSPHLERALANGSRNFLNEFGKPTLNGEFGLGGNANLANADPDGIHLHNCMWGGLFGGAMGTAMTWWWDTYVHPKDLYHHFTGVNAVASQVPFLEKDMKPTSAVITGAPGDLVLTPTLSWAGIGTAAISIDETGQVTPPDAALGQFLYGSQWNVQYRSPPVFTVDFPQSGQFKVMTGNETGQAPILAIYLDGALLLQQNAATGQTYTIDVPAGQHTVKVDNLGTDWITIASYTFTGVGSGLDNYTLVSQDKQAAAGWVLNNSYNHEYVVANGAPDAAEGGVFHLDGFANGNYFVKWYNCLTGALFDVAQVQVTNEALQFSVPTTLWDAAFLVDGTPASVAVGEAKQDLAFRVFPSPTTAGMQLDIVLGKNAGAGLSAALLDMSGKEVVHFGNIPDLATALTLQLPKDIGAGLYWVRLTGGNRVGTQALMIGK